MAEFAAVTDDDLARARRDAAFRHKLLAGNLEFLLAALNKLRASSRAAEPACAGQIRAGVQLAVQLADMLRAYADKGPPQAA
jgi:hypothetical protein